MTRDERPPSPTVLTIRLDQRLPDVNRIDQVPPEFERYGRFAILSNGGLWFGETGSSHPSSTDNGFYWAVAGTTVYLSPRGSTYRWRTHISPEVIAWLLEKLYLKRYARRYRVVEAGV